MSRWTNIEYLADPRPTVYMYTATYVCVYVLVYVHSYARVRVCMYMHIGMDILRFMHEYVFAFMRVPVFIVSFFAHVYSFDGNLVCFCPVYTLLPQERRRRLGKLSKCWDRHMVSSTFSVDMHSIFSMSFFCAYV